MESTETEKLNKSLEVLPPGLRNQTTEFHIEWGVNFSTTSETFVYMTDNKTITSSNGQTEEFLTAFIVASIVCVVGVLSNTAAIIFFLVQKKLKIPPYTAVFCSSIANLLALIARYLMFFIVIMNIGTNTSYYMYGISFFTDLSSYFHVLIIAVIRYIYVSKPFYSLTFRYSKVLFMSCGAWIASLLIATLYRIYLYLLQEKVLSMKISFYVEISITFILFFGSLIPIVILHVLNIKNLWKGLSNSTTVVSKDMSTVIAAIIILFIVSNIPSIVINLLQLFNVNNQTGGYMQIFLMFYYCSNSFVYFFCSKAIKSVLVEVFTCKCYRNH